MAIKKRSAVEIRGIKINQIPDEGASEQTFIKGPASEESTNEFPIVRRLPTNEKYTLTIQEASQYFSIGVKKLRRLAEDNLDSYAVYNGNRLRIIRQKFEDYLCKATEI